MSVYLSNSAPVLARRSVRFVATSLLMIAITCCVGGSAEAQQRKLLSNTRFVLGTESRLSASVRAGDMDGDGDIDLVVANGRHWPQQNMLFLNQGRCRFNVARPLGIDQCTSYACELADLDGDGDLDIAVGNDSAPCLVFLNDGHAHFTRHCEFAPPASVRSLTTADIDGDGDIDLLTTCRGAPNRIYYNDGKALFGKAASFGANNDSTIDVAVADLNEDGVKDLILANRDSQPNTIQLGTGDGGFKAGLGFGEAKASSRAVATADFDGDGHADWVVGNIQSQNKVFFGDGKGGVIREVSLGDSASRTYSVAVADLNNDQLPDIVFGNVGQANSVFFNTAGSEKFTGQRFGNPESSTYGLCIGDFTGDGFADVATANSGLKNSIYVNQPVRKKTP